MELGQVCNSLNEVDFTQIPCLHQFKPMESQKYVDYKMNNLAESLPEFGHWLNTKPFETPVKLEGKVVTGFKRGSKELGIPTANIEMTEENVKKTKELIPGVYIGKARFNGQTYLTAASIGWNPVYDNNFKTIEAFILETFDSDFYDQPLAVEFHSFARAEALFDSYDDLIWAIQCDIQACKQTLSNF